MWLAMVCATVLYDLEIVCRFDTADLEGWQKETL
jgi:hypothetical protein